MSHRPACQTADFFVLRSPGLPVGALFPQVVGGPVEPPEALDERLRALVRDDAVREALALASPDLAARLDPWLAGTLEAAAARGVMRSLLKYLSRMGSRATPFGLFAGISLGAWGAASQLALGPWRASRKALRLDWGVLEALVDRLAQAPEVRAGLTFRPNTSLYLRGGWYRYLERRDGEAGQGRTYHLEAVEATPHLEAVLQQAQGGGRLEDLALALAPQAGVTPTDALAFLDQLVEAQVLCGDLQPPLSCADPLAHVVAALEAHPRAAPRAAALRALAVELRAFQQAPAGTHAGGLPGLTACLASLGLSPDTRDLLQVDLHRPAPGLALSPPVRRALEEGAELLRRLTPPPAEGPLDRFRSAFLARYGTRWVPLLEVLDEESGLGFDGGTPTESPLLAGLPLAGPAPARPFTLRDQALLGRLMGQQGARTWALSEADVAALSQPDPPPFPASFAALASLEAASPAALDQGDFRLWMEHHSGPTAARWVGRFASGDAALQAALARHLQREVAGHPEAVFAEVVHVPEGRMGNVLARPALRTHEIPFLATSGVSEAHTLLPADLQVTVRGDRVCLASTRLDREVIPRLSSAHNFNRGPGVYRFLAHLQDQDGRPGGWSWGALADLPFLPRVTRGRHVLTLARWKLAASELQAALASAPDGAVGAFRALRARHGLPRFVRLSDADNQLLVDLELAPWVEALHQLVAHRPDFTLTECFPDPGQRLVTAPEGAFAHELVVPFEATPMASPRLALPSREVAPPVRGYAPGSEWLYLRLACGPASADRLLVELAPLLGAAQAEGLCDRWHFVRYRDPEHHLRVRLHGPPTRLLCDLLPRLHAHLDPPLAQGLLRAWQVDTFEPEWERYGGPQGFALAEAWFHEDSQLVLDQLLGGLSPDLRWRQGLRQVDAIWAALGLDRAQRKALAGTTRDAFRKEFGDTGPGAIHLGQTFRGLRRELEDGFPLRLGGPRPPWAASALPRLRAAFDEGKVRADLLRLAGTLSHMHLNRLLRAEHRASEWALMEFLVRLYEAHLKRFPDDAW